MCLRIFVLIFSMALTSCASNVSSTFPVEANPTSQKINFVDISKFDRDLSVSLQSRSSSVEVAFYDKVSPNNVPERLQKWISVVEGNGGKVLIEPPQNEAATRSPFAAVSLIGTLISSIKRLAEFNAEKIYESAKGRNAVISLERNTDGQVFVTSIKFVKPIQ